MNIIVEGISGTGKTTIIDNFEKRLGDEQIEPVIIGDLTYETPIKSILLNMVEESPLMNEKRNFKTSIYESLLLAANHHYVQEKLRSEESICIYDRDFLSLLVYQKLLLKEEYENWEEIYNAYKKIVLFNLKKIDLLVYIHVPLDIAIKRTEKRDNRSYSKKDIELIEEMIKEYEKLLEDLKNDIDILKINGEEEVEENVKKIYKKIIGRV